MRRVPGKGRVSDCIVRQGRLLRRGYTTGSCATAAAVAATRRLLQGQAPLSVAIALPSGEEVEFTVQLCAVTENSVTCGVVKDAGDDPDVTDGMLVMAECARTAGGIQILGGEGVGRVTAEGLALPPGSPAINPAPLRMISENLRKVCLENAYTGGIAVTVSIPGGEEVAKKTFNPRLGITGGLSILGTTGRVNPMSRKAFMDTVRLVIDQYALRGKERIILTPGNYGTDHCVRILGIARENIVQIANFVGESLDYCLGRGFSEILLAGHAGKFVKLAGGIMNTHSSEADCRMELVAAHAAAEGAGQETARRILAAPTVEAALSALDGQGLGERVRARLLERALWHLRARAAGRAEVGLMVFSAGRTILRSENAEAMLRSFLQERQVVTLHFPEGGKA